MESMKKQPDLSGIATLSNNPLANYHLDGKAQKNKPKPCVTKKGSRK